MRIVYQHCCGMDVHKNSVTACVLRIDEYGEPWTETRYFRTMTRALREMSTWLASLGVEAIAMEATGVYWKPVWNILEAEKKFRLLLVNAHHIKQVPGRKTDQKDSEWIAELLQHGLLKGSFVPPQAIRQLRDLTRMRVKIRQTLASFANRVQKVLEDANIKLGSVASDVLGVSGRHMLQAMVEGQQDPKQLAELAQGKLRDKLGELQLALEGQVTDHHRFQLKFLLEFVEFTERQLIQLESEIQRIITRIEPEPVGSPVALMGHDPRNRSTNGLDFSGRDGSQYGSVSHCSARGQMGGDLSREQGKRGKQLNHCFVRDSFEARLGLPPAH